MIEYRLPDGHSGVLQPTENARHPVKDGMPGVF